MNESLVLTRREHDQALNAVMAVAFPHEVDAYQDRVGRNGMRALSTLMLAGVVASGVGFAANSDGESAGPGYYGYDNIELPADLPLIAEVRRTSVDASIATVAAAAEVRPALANVKECKPNVNNVIFYAEKTSDSSDGPALTGSTVEEVKAEAYDRFAHDPLLVAKKRHSLKLANHTEKTLVEQTKRYMADQPLWEKECQELINSIEGAKSVTIENRSGTYLTEYTNDDMNKDGVPDPAMGYEKTVNANMRVLVIVLADGTVAELKLDCGLQDMQFHKEVRRKVEEKKKEEDEATTTSSTTSTTAPPPTTSSTTSSTTSTIAPPTTTSSTTAPPPTTSSTTSSTTSTIAPPTTTSSTSTSTTVPQAPKVLYCVGPNGIVQVGDVNNDGDIDQLDIDQTAACNELPNNGPGSGGNEGPVGTTSTTAETTSTTQQTNTTVTPTTTPRPTSTLPPVNVPTSTSSTVPAGPGPDPDTVFIP
jgi:hypothetical protein